MENQSRMEWGWNMMKHGRRLIVGILAVRILRSIMSEFKIWSFDATREDMVFMWCVFVVMYLVFPAGPFCSMQVLWASVAVENWFIYSTADCPILPLLESSDLIGPEEGVAHRFQWSQNRSEALNLRAAWCMDWACQNPGLVANLTSDLTTAKNHTGW